VASGFDHEGLLEVPGKGPDFSAEVEDLAVGSEDESSQGGGGQDG
jgi:hypothetical protein